MKPLVAAVPTPEVKVTIGQMRVPSDFWVRIVLCPLYQGGYAADPDLKQRFEREAKTISSLNHPHICTLYDIGSKDGIDFLVMEYLDGETLAQGWRKELA